MNVSFLQLICPTGLSSGLSPAAHSVNSSNFGSGNFLHNWFQFSFQNIMTFNQCSIKGRAYGDPVDEHGNPMDITVVSIFSCASFSLWFVKYV